MTPDELEKLVVEGDTLRLADAVANLTESERRGLSKTAQALKREIDQASWEVIDGSYVQRLTKRLATYLVGKQGDLGQQTWAADLAVLAVGPLSQAKKVRLHGPGPGKTDTVLKVMIDRRPEWIDEWVAAKLEGDFPELSWDALWGLIHAGVCKKPTTDAYYRAIAHLLGGWHSWIRGEQVPLSERLANEPALLEDVWKLFEVDTVAFAADLGEGRDASHESWSTALLKLADRGLLDRDRLLDATLDGQIAGFKLNVVSGIARLHERLDPSAEEMAARQAAYGDLMSAHQTQVVAFAVKMLKKLEQAKRLGDASFVNAASAVFRVETKGPPKAVILLLKKIAKREPDLVPEIGRTLLEGLSHPAEEVQAAVIDLLSMMKDRLDDQTTGEIAARLDDLPAVVRPKAEELVMQTGGRIEAVHRKSDMDARLAECRMRIDKIDRHWQEAAGVLTALEAVETTCWPPALDFDAMQVPVLSGLKAVQPIETTEELVDAVAHGIEQVPSAMEVERILDGISRMCGPRPQGFERLAAPLLQRFEQVIESNTPHGIAHPHIAPRLLCRTVYAWLADQREVASLPKEPRSITDVTAFINGRLDPLRHRIAKQKPAPLLAAPTHEYGWVDPAVIVARWQEIEASGSHPPKFEIVQALLRMAPDGREKALASAGGLTHKWAKPLRWALGGDIGPTASDAEDANLWLAAGRARSPRGFLEELVPLRLGVGPDAVQPATYPWRAHVRNEKYQDQVFRFPELKLETEPPLVRDPAPSLATVLLHKRASAWLPYNAGAPWVYEWISMVWPANADSFFATGCHCVASRIDEVGSALEPNHAYFPPLFEADRPWGKLGNLLVVLGVVGRDQDVRGLAVDALVEAIGDGRVHPTDLGEVLRQLTEPYWLKLNRLCENLNDVARISPLHAWNVMASLHELLGAYDELPRDAHYLLAQLQELQAQLGVSLPLRAREKLQEVRGSSKTAKLAKSLLTYEPSQLTPAGREALILVLESRLNRAERWAHAHTEAGISDLRKAV